MTKFRFFCLNEFKLDNKTFKYIGTKNLYINAILKFIASYFALTTYKIKI